ncbi:DUF1264 domain-containing protein [Luteibacter sp. W1I16]|uniref:OBAP family protein n=1 Tax=Luteibacter sp. W1I16 TaxID=3373922 RepID=UPI003D1A2667
MLILLLTACNGGHTESPVGTPGAEKSTKTKALEAGASMLQSAPPLGALNMYLDGFHFYNGRIESQMEAHHYCSGLNEDIKQCVIYDGNTANAKIMGVEYIVSARVFATLPDAEKPLWHSHAYEVTSGELVAPGLPRAAEHELMEKLASTYGKTFHTWHTDLQKHLPLGVPQLMMGFTQDGQIDRAMVRSRDERLGVDTEEKRRERADIKPPPVQEGADAWQRGTVMQIADPTGGSHNQRGKENGMTR